MPKSQRKSFLKTIVTSIHSQFNDMFVRAFKRKIESESQQTVLASVVLIWGDIVTMSNNLATHERISNPNSDSSNQLPADLRLPTQTASTSNEQIRFEIISIGSGTKSIGRKAMEKPTNRGGVLHDSHAEVLARRAFKRFLIENIRNPQYFTIDAISGKSQPNFKVLFYSSQSPCGSASMSTLLDNQKLSEEAISIAKPTELSDISSSTTSLQQSSIQETTLFQNTGAKYYEFLFDTKYIAEKDIDPDILRVKPGRSDLPPEHRSCSLSCSDKLMLWNILGMQGGCLTEHLTRPIFIDFLFVESDGKNSGSFKQRLQHALLATKRLPKAINPPAFLQKNNEESNPNESSVLPEEVVAEDEANGLDRAAIVPEGKNEACSNHEFKQQSSSSSEDKFKNQNRIQISNSIPDKNNCRKGDTQRQFKLGKVIRKQGMRVHQPKIIVSKKIMFLLNRQLSSNKPKYLDQHLVWLVAPSKELINSNQQQISTGNPQNRFEIINGATGLKWGMGEKGAQIKKNFPMLSKHALFNAMNEAGLFGKSTSQENSTYASAKNAEATQVYRSVKANVLEYFQSRLVDKRAVDIFTI